MLARGSSRKRGSDIEGTSQLKVGVGNCVESVLEAGVITEAGAADVIGGEPGRGGWLAALVDDPARSATVRSRDVAPEAPAVGRDLVVLS
jgi:hypothetical protein